MCSRTSAWSISSRNQIIICRNGLNLSARWLRTKRLDTLLKSIMLSAVLNKRPLFIKHPPRIWFFFLKKHPNSNKQSHSNKRPCSVSVIALLEYMYIEINRGSSSFHCSHVASLQKQWASSQSLNYYVYVSAQFLQTNKMFATFAWIFVLWRM